MSANDEFLLGVLAAARRAAAEGAPIVPAVVAAQAALESAWGNSRLARDANNLFGIKAGRSWAGEVLELPTREFDPETGWIRMLARWRKYPSWTACIADYAAILKRLSWFADAVAAAERGDAMGFLDGLLPRKGEPGWATDPAYRSKVLSVMRRLGEAV